MIISLKNKYKINVENAICQKDKTINIANFLIDNNNFIDLRNSKRLNQRFSSSSPRYQ